MERIKNILGLGVHNECVMDRFDLSLVRIFKQIENKLLNNPEGIYVAEEAGPLERRSEILDNEKDKAYGEALHLLSKLRPEYKKYLPEAKKAPRFLSDLLKRRMRLAFWVEMGNQIPFRELNALLVKNLLKEKGYVYRRKKDEMGWYRVGLFVGENLFDALENLEKFEAVDRSRLTISF